MKHVYASVDMAPGAEMLALEDRRLLRELNHGSRDALRRIYQKYRCELFTIGVALVGDRDLAEDCLQDVFVRLAESAGRIRVAGNLKAYLASCVVNRARDQVRREVKRVGCVGATPCGCPGQARGPAPTASAPSPAQQLVNDERAAAMLDAIGQLPGEQREVFVLHAQAGLSFRDIAATQGVPLRTTHSRYRYAIGKLRELLPEGT
jgi:RNA polymerase sigma-70 factor (ECF subfamily)